MSGLVLSIACSLQLSSLVVGAPAPSDAPVPASVVPALACPSCEDYNACTVDSCDTTTGTCRHDPLNCDDGNPCTNDTCDPYQGCLPLLLPAGTACDDGKA
ncbi:MAG TPA: hypothetical protein VNL37_05725, partial [Candidatus Polarisedimenticolia bacterium]|nr:hypothetical protein [Candidatus Polarisedimenticolia bacterium]